MSIIQGQLFTVLGQTFFILCFTGRIYQNAMSGIGIKIKIKYQIFKTTALKMEYNYELEMMNTFSADIRQ